MVDTLNDEQKNGLHHRLAMYEQLGHLYPQNHEYLQHQIEILLQLEDHDEAELLLDKLQRKLLHNGLKKDAAKADILRRHLSQKKHSNRFYSTPFLHLASSKFMEKALRFHQRIALKEGQYLIHYGEQDEQMFIVLDGELAVWSHDAQGKKHLEHLLHAGEVIGELAFLDGTPRNADVLACKASTLLAIPSKDVLKLFLENPKVEAALREEATIRKFQVEMKKNNDLARLPSNLQRILAKSGAFIHAGTLERMFQTGENITSIDLICDGYIRLLGDTHHGESIALESLKAGSLLGCSALIPHMQKKHVTDIVSMNESTLIRFPLAAFAKVLDHSPRLYQVLRAEAEKSNGQLISTMQIKPAS
ncbi:MAG: cyclic nucleotide-binding domain-containing protein [Ghiorsea sp.]